MSISRSAGGARAHRLLAARTLQLCAIAICAALLLGLTISYIALLTHGDAGVKQTDFMAYYSGARLVLAGHGRSLYDFAALAHFERRLVYPLHVRNGVLPFVYPPYVALLLAPLAALPYGLAYLLWLCLNCALLSAIVRALQRYMQLGWGGSILLWLATWSFIPVFVALAQGQTSIVLLALFVAAFFALRSGREVGVGVCLALALVKPPYVATFLLILLLQRRWRAVVAFVIAAVILVLIPLAALGPSASLGYVHTLVRASTWQAQFGYGPQWNHSLAGFDQLVVPSALAGKVTDLLDLMAMAALAYVSRDRFDIERSYGLAAVVGLLIAPHVLIHDLCLVLLPVCVIVRWRDEDSRRAAGLIVAGYGFLLLGLRLVSILHLQMSVMALTALGCWLLLTRAGGGRAMPALGRKVRGVAARGTPFPAKVCPFGE